MGVTTWSADAAAAADERFSRRAFGFAAPGLAAGAPPAA
jgi:hypothetical protein